MRFFCIAFIAWVYASHAYAGAWTQPKGEGFFIANASFYSTDAFFARNSSRRSQDRFSKVEFQPYLEYGLRDDLTIGGSFFAQSNYQSGSNKVGIGDPEIFLRQHIYRDAKNVVSLQPLFKFASLYRDSDSLPRSGSSSNDYELSLLYGRNLNLTSTRDYADMRLGYRHRGGTLNDQWRVDAVLGLEVAKGLQIIPALRGTISTSLTDAETFSQNGDLDYDLLRAELGSTYRLNQQQQLNLTLFNHFAGRQTGGGFGITTGFVQRF